MSVAATWRQGYTNHSSSFVAVFEPRRRITQIPIIYCPGIGAGPKEQYVSMEMLGAVDTGIVGIVGELPSPQGATWGNDSSLASLTDLIAWAGATLGTRTDKVALIGGSHGGFTAANYAVAHISQIAAIAFAIPALSLQGIHDRNLLGFGDSIETAYGGHAAYVAAIPTHDPLVTAPQLTPIGSKMRAWYSSGDAVTLPSEVTAWATATGAVATDFGPYGHVGPTDPTANYWQQMVDWLAPRLWWA